MALIEYTFDGRVDKVQRAIDRIRAFDPIANGFADDCFFTAYSGGKDSDCLRMPCEQWDTAEDVLRWWLEGPQRDPADGLDQLSLY